MGENLWCKVKSYVAGWRDYITTSARMFFICSLMMAVMSLINTTRDITTCTDMYSRLQSDLVITSDHYKKMFIIDGYKNAELHAESLKDQLSNRIEEEYKGDFYRLEHDLTTYTKNNDINNSLYKIFTDTCFKYKDRWFYGRNDVRIIVCDRNNVLFSSKENEPLRDVTMNTNLIFNRPTSTILRYSYILGSLTAESISTVGDNLDAMEDYEFYTTAYIYEHKDLLGNLDVMPNGTARNNYKLAIIIVYKPVDTNTMYILRNMDSEIKTSMRYNYADVISAGLRTFMIWFALTILFGYIAFKRRMSVE